MCDIPYCRKKEIEVIYYDHNICKHCFLKYDTIELKQILDINTNLITSEKIVENKAGQLTMASFVLVPEIPTHDSLKVAL